MKRCPARRLIGASLVALGLALTAASADAAVPGSITHQGRLYDAENAPVKAALDVTFTLYDGPNEGAAAIWTETHSVAFDDGYFSVELGLMKPFDAKVFDGSVRHLGIQVGSDEEMSPRAAVRSVPYALMANDVNGDIHPHSVSIQDIGVVINESGQWVGDPAGLQGPAGPQGPMGTAGPAGPMGPQGATGATGPEGAMGPAGPAGPQGLVGATGPAGAMGPTGAMGPAGATGPAGPQGPMGPVGSTGAMGPAGAVGAEGPMGPQGVKGATGATGAAGAAGATGPAGPTGAMGPAGPPGPPGTIGPGTTGRDILFTRAKLADGSPDPTKDALCASEFGGGYRAASQLDVHGLYQSIFSSSPNFTVAGAASLYISGSNGLLYFNSTSGFTTQVACLRLEASPVFTRAKLADGSTDAMKDALCAAEFGAAYRAASQLDLHSLYRSRFSSSPTFTVAGAASLYISGSNSLLYFNSTSGFVPQVACVAY